VGVFVPCVAGESDDWTLLLAFHALHYNYIEPSSCSFYSSQCRSIGNIHHGRLFLKINENFTHLMGALIYG
jgi:hypothetical protein